LASIKNVNGKNKVWGVWGLEKRGGGKISLAWGAKKAKCSGKKNDKGKCKPGAKKECFGGWAKKKKIEKKEKNQEPQGGPIPSKKKKKKKGGMKAAKWVYRHRGLESPQSKKKRVVLFCFKGMGHRTL